MSRQRLPRNGLRPPRFDWTGAPKLQVTGRLFIPAGSGRFPVVVLLHGCGGTRSNGPKWGEWLAESGFAALFVDSFSPRGLDNVCSRPPGRAAFELVVAMTEDAFSAALFLAARPDIDAGRRGVHIGGNRAARDLARRDALAFLRRALGPSAQ